MVDLGLDYSDARPGGAALAAAHVVAVGRYLGNDSRCITPSEYQDLTRHGIGVWLVKESQTVDLSVSMLNGYNKGVADALAASAAIKQVGLPDGSPVYWAADFDIAPGSARVAQAESYVDGWNTIIPEGRRGGYGGLWFLNYLHGKGKVDFLWECASTSFRHGINPASVPLHIQQTTDNPPIAGTDYNNIFDTSSFAGNGGATPITNTVHEEDDMTIYRAVTASTDGRIGKGYCYVQDAAGPLRAVDNSEGSVIVAKEAKGLVFIADWNGDDIRSLITRVGILEYQAMPAGAKMSTGTPLIGPGKLTGRIIYDNATLPDYPKVSVV